MLQVEASNAGLNFVFVAFILTKLNKKINTILLSRELVGKNIAFLFNNSHGLFLSLYEHISPHIIIVMNDNRIESKLFDEILKVERNGNWVKIPFADYPLTKDEMEIFNEGYGPDWECRYAPCYLNGWHYIVRSGTFVRKFKYQKQRDGRYHITEMYGAEPDLDWDVFYHVMCIGYFKRSIDNPRKRDEYFENWRQVSRGPIMVESQPEDCCFCHGQKTVKEIIYGEPAPELMEKYRRKEIVLGGCCITCDDPEWACTHCGQTYKMRVCNS
jgi:hypothetical protein